MTLFDGLEDELPAQRSGSTARLSPGLLAFIGLLTLPAVAAFFIFLGAWLVSDEVHAAEASQAPAPEASALTNDDFGGTDVAGWKKALVGVCPLH